MARLDELVLSLERGIDRLIRCLRRRGLTEVTSTGVGAALLHRVSCTNLLGPVLYWLKMIRHI